MGVKRYLTYLRKKVLRLSASPHAIGAGVASGAAVSMFPLVGLHFLLGFVLAYITRGNMIAAAIGTAWGNPVTFPFFFTAAYAIGDWLRGGAGEAPASNVGAVSASLNDGLFSGGLDAVWPAFSTMMIGGAPLALLVYGGFYLAVRAIVTSFRTARLARMAERRAATGDIAGR